VVVEEGEGGEEDAVGDGRMSSFRLRLVSIYPLAPILQPLSPPQREGGVVVGGDERRFYTDDSYIIFAALHVGQGQGVGTRSRSGDKVKEWRRVEVFGASDGRVHVQGTGEGVELVLRLYPHMPSGRFYGGPGANGIVSSSWGWSHEGCAHEVRWALHFLLLSVDHD